MAGCRIAAKKFLHVLMKIGIFGKSLGISSQLGPGWQLPVNKEIGGFYKRGLLSQLFDRITPVA